MNKNPLITYLKDLENDFKLFMNIEEFPTYELQTKEVSETIAATQGFDVAAAAFYQPQSKSHTLLVSTNLVLSKYLVFHEFTHILDSEMYANSDKMRYVGLSGFTEYHASQVELIQLLGANTFDQTLSFSMNTIVSTFAGEKSVSEYVEGKQQHAIELFSRSDFPADINTLKSAIGVLYNYWGLRSICEMYSTDYTEKINNEAFLKFIPTQVFSIQNRLMHNHLDKGQIELSMQAYMCTVMPLIQTYKLQ